MQTNNEYSPDETDTIPPITPSPDKHDETDTISPITPSPNKRNHKRKAAFGRYNRVTKKLKRNNPNPNPRAPYPQRRSSLGLVDLQSSGDELDLGNGYHVAPVSMDEYLAIHNSDRVFFGTNHTFVWNLAIS